MTEPGHPRIFLVDGYALIYRAFYAMIARPLRTSRGENTSAVWGVANFLQRLTQKQQPEFVAWVHDSGRSFRHDTFPAYKATREKLSDDLQADFNTGIERVVQLLDAYSIPIISLEGFEADDVIGTLVKQSVERGINVVVVSGDKDFHQLVRRGVWLLNPGRGGPAGVEEHWVSTENASERMGVQPDRVTDFLALIGDSSDNVPGVPGIGEKTAIELLSRYGDLEQIIAHAPEIEKKRPREALLANIDNARLSRDLVTIREDLPIVLDTDAMRTREPDARKLRDLFVKLEFQTLVRDVPESAAETVAAAIATAKHTVVETALQADSVATKARAAGRVTIATVIGPASADQQITGAARGRLVGIALGISAGDTYYFPFGHRSADAAQGELAGFAATTTVAGESPSESHGANPDDGTPANLPALGSNGMNLLRELLEDANVAKWGHDLKHSMLTLRRAGVSLRGAELDTMIASYVLDPGRRAHDLPLLTLEFLGEKLAEFSDIAGKGKTAVAADRLRVATLRDYACETVNAATRLGELFHPQLRHSKLDALYRDIEIPLIPVLAEMEWTGIGIDMPWFRSLKERFQRERDRVTREIYAMAGTEFNINSSQQLREILFGKLALPVLKKTATGPSTDASVLQQFAEQGEQLPALILEYRELAKLESTYIDSLPTLVNPETGRIHTSFNQTVASTGRLSSSDPNLQNIPVRRELGRDIRRGFIPRKGWKLVAADYSQIELRLLAHLSGDPAFVTAFREGGDVHRQTASVIFGVELDDVTPEMRARAKTINFATIYGQGPRALSQQLGIDYNEAKLFISTYFERFKGIREYLDSRVAFAKENGYVETIFGRRRYIPELRDRNFNIRAFGERTAANSPIQGSAADLIKLAMIRIDHTIRKERFESRMLLQVHDELVFEVLPEELAAVTAAVKAGMEEAAELSVPLVVDIGVGADWVSAKS